MTIELYHTAPRGPPRKVLVGATVKVLPHAVGQVSPSARRVEGFVVS